MSSLNPALLGLTLCATLPLAATPPPQDRPALPRTLLDIAGAKADPARYGDSVLVLIDHQREYVDGGVPLQGVPAAVAQIKVLLDQARNHGTPVVHILHVAKPGAALFNPDGPYVAIIDGLQPLAGEVVVKKSLPNGFAHTELDEVLRKTGRKKLLFAGFATHMCVSATTRAALDHGYASTVVAAACADRDLPDGQGGILPAAAMHRAALAALSDRFATIVPDASTIQN
jgi:nicotinamidase-related amidase